MFASVKVPALTSKVFPDPTVMFDVAIVAPSIVPESISTLVVFWLSKSTGLEKVIAVSSADMVSKAILPTLVILPSVTLNDVNVPAPAPSVPVVDRFSFPKSIAPELSTILPVEIVIVPSTLN